MAKGRKAKPTHLKVIEGDRGKRGVTQNEPQPRAVEPDKPDFTTQAASRCWDRIVVELRAMGILHAADRDALEIYCEAYGTWKTAQAGVAKGVLVNRGTETHPHPVTNPSWRVARDAAGLVTKLGEAFGLTPAARARIELPEADDGDLGELFLKP